MADEDDKAAPKSPGTTRKKTKKKAAKKKAAKKKASKKKVAARAAPAEGGAPEAEPAEPPRPPRPEPSVAAHAAAPSPAGTDESGAGEDSGMSGWLVMWGPLIIVGFLILVFMGNEREPATVAVAPEASQPEPAAAEAEAETPAVESGLDISPEKAAADLAEAFKAAGLPVPESATAGAAAATSGEAELPPEMKANPWAPQPGQAEEVPVAPPPPGYGQYPYGAYPPPMGYGYGARPGYGWGPPPGYGYGYGGMMPPAGMGGPMGGQMRGYGRGYGGYRMPHEGMPHEGMPHEGMPHEGMPYPGMPHPGMMPDHGGQQSGDSSAPPPPSDAAQPGNN